MTTATLDVETVPSLSETIIPSVKGKFYSYPTEFSSEKPLYFLWDCKANKAHSLATDVETILTELNLTFIFGDDVFLSSPNSAPSVKLLNGDLGNINASSLIETEIRSTNLSPDAFYLCFCEKSQTQLIDLFAAADSGESTLLLSEGLVVAIRTASNKYGLLLVKRLTASKCEIDACHILP
jgi:hypothetical protein